MSLSKRSLEDAQSLMAANTNKGDAETERAMRLKSDWNNFQNWLLKKGVAGHPDLDKGVGEDNNGIKLVRLYQKENPSTLVTPENIAEIQTHFKNYRDYTINQLRTGKAQLVDAQNPKGRLVKPDENLDNYMAALSKVDGIPGSLTTQHIFPNEFLTTIYKDPKGKVEKTETINKGLATN